MTEWPPRSRTEPQVAIGAVAAAGESGAGEVRYSPLSSPADFSPETSDWGSVFGDDPVPIAEVSELALADEPPQPKKRGRRPSRPFDAVRKKTEEKDKFWLRAFRAYMKGRYLTIRKELSPQDRFFWRDYLSPESVPDKGNRYSSFGRKYKCDLFSNPSFVTEFQNWFRTQGESVLMKKCDRLSPLWSVFYEYCAKDLFYYNPSSPPVDSGSVSPETRESPEPADRVDEYQLLVEEEADVEMLLEEL